MKSVTTYLGIVGTIVFLNVSPLHAQVSTIKSGRWSTPSVWSTGVVPDASTTTSITLVHNITLPADTTITVDNLTINATLTIEKHAELILSNDGTANADIAMNGGTLQVHGKVICLDGATFSGTSPLNTFFHDSATYEHQYVNTAGEPPLANWSKNSEMLITGYVFGKSLNSLHWNQSFGNITYDCAGQRSGTFVEMLGNVQHVKGNFVVKNTNSGVLRFSLDKTSLTNISIEGDLIIEGRSEFWLGRNANIALHVGGDLVFQSTSTASTYLTTTGLSSVVVDGSVIINSTAPFRFASSGGGHSALRVRKNFLLIQGNATVLPIGTGELIFEGTQAQTFHAGGILASGINVTIDNADVSITNNSRIGGNLSLRPGSKLHLPAVCSLESDLHVESGADIVDHQGTLFLLGTTNQQLNLSGDTLQNLSITKSANTVVSLSSKLNLSGTLALKSTSTTFNSNGFLTLLSQSDDGTKDAIIETIPNESLVAGIVTVQRYMSGEGRIYRYLSSPVRGSTVADCKDDFPVTGNFTDPSSGGGLASTSASLFYYDETRAASAGWVAFPAIGLASENVLAPARGYAAFIRKSSAPTIWDVEGTINQHEITFPVTHTITGDVLNDGWNLVGNPYPAQIDWDAVDGWAKFNIADKIAVKDNSTGMFHYWSEGIGSLAGGRIAKGQAFWIQTVGNNASLTINEKAKTTQATEFHRSRTTLSDYIEVALSHGSNTDKAFLRQKSGTDFGFDQSDVTKWPNDHFNIAFRYDSLNLSIQNIEHVNCGGLIPLHVYFTRDAHGNWTAPPHGDYILESNSTGTFAHAQIFLHDNFTNQAVTLVSPYHFSITNETGSIDENRFALALIADTLIRHVQTSSERVDCNTMKFRLAELQRGVRYTCMLNGVPLKNFLGDDSTSYEFNLHESEMTEGENVLEINGRTACTSTRIQSVTFQNDHEHTPQIIEENNILKVLIPGKKQWLLNGYILEGDTMDTCIITNPGLYEIEVNNGGCVTRASHMIQQNENVISCFPNPTHGSVTVVAPQEIDSIILIDLYGRLILATDGIRHYNHTICLQTLAKGSYILVVKTGSRSENIKIVKAD